MTDEAEKMDREKGGRAESPGAEAAPKKGPPPLRPFGLVLHHDGRFSHEGAPILNRKLREHFDRSVDYLVDEEKYIVRLGHFRGEIVVEEAGFFVRAYDATRGEVSLSDGRVERIDPSTLRESPIDGALLCQIRRDLRPEGLPARFFHGPQADLLQSIEEEGEGFVLPVAGARLPVNL